MVIYNGETPMISNSKKIFIFNFIYFISLDYIWYTDKQGKMYYDTPIAKTKNIWYINIPKINKTLRILIIQR
jgi:hypothetical protein